MVTPFLNISEQYDRTEYEAIYSGAGPDDYDEYIASKMTHAVFLIHVHPLLYLSMHTRSTYRGYANDVKIAFSFPARHFGWQKSVFGYGREHGEELLRLRMRQPPYERVLSLFLSLSS